MADPLKTVFYDRHLAHGARMVEFGGSLMPIQYGGGIVQEHLETRKRAGLFDVSHMGRFRFRGSRALSFLQHVLSNNAAALEPGESQYTLLQNAAGGALDDAYLYRFVPDEYLLVVNAANRKNDWAYFTSVLGSGPFEGVEMEDATDDLAMLSLQGPLSKDILSALVESGSLPEPMRNRTSLARIRGIDLLVSRTGYTGDPVGFELFMGREEGPKMWDLLTGSGAVPVGLGARDTLRLEAGLPLYGHELGRDPEGGEIPVFALGLSRFAVSFSPLKGEFVGKGPLLRQHNAYRKILERDFSLLEDLPRMIQPVALTGKGVARSGNELFAGERKVGYVTSGTAVPYWKIRGEGISSVPTEEKGVRSLTLSLIDSRLRKGEILEIDIRGRRSAGIIVPYHLRGDAPPYARPILCLSGDACEEKAPRPDPETVRKVGLLLSKAVRNTLWRRRECVNLIPSEQTPSIMSRLLSISDPAGRYAEHKRIKAFCEAEVFYYQGTDFIAEVERLLTDELRGYLSCGRVETRPISGQMANTAVFSALVDFLNRGDRRSEQRRIRKVLNHHIIKGGHLSAQPMGALRDYVARDPVTEKPAVVPFPVLREDPFRIDIDACRKILEMHAPELIILGKSMVLYTEPVAEIRKTVDALGLPSLILYDAAHVLGLIGPHFQEPFAEGADLVTGSTHKTYFGTQRGIIAADFPAGGPAEELWEAIERRTFPGSVSNHHPGTLLGLLLAAYEMNFFRDAYQKKVIENAKAFAVALKESGLDVAGDPGVSFTQTHQVILRVGYGRGAGIARKLEENNIIVNYQATPEEEGFTAAGALRMGVAEMTRFGMEPADFREFSLLLRDAIRGAAGVREAVASFRKRFLEMRYCFSGSEFDPFLEDLRRH